MRIDLHNHTTLCNHAEGTVQEYVEQAIREGVDVFGFSDHAPMGFDPRYRMQFDQMEAYSEMVHKAKEQYRDQIDILFAYEVDYLPGHMDERVMKADVDYFIGSVHFIDEWGFDNPEFIGRYQHEDIDYVWQRYFDLIVSMAQSRKFDIVGHLDLIKVFKFLPSGPVLDFAEKSLEAIKEADMVLEINVSGYRKPIGEAYPSPELLKRAFDLGIPITFGSDAHKPEQVGLYYEEASALAKSIGYTECAIFRNRARSMVKF